MDTGRVQAIAWLNQNLRLAAIIYRVIRLPLRYLIFSHDFRFILELILDNKIRFRDIDLK